MSAELAYADVLPMFGFVVDRCTGCGKYRAGIEVVYVSHWSYMDPPDYDEYWLCPRCIAESELNDLASDVGEYEMYVGELEGDPAVEAERAVLAAYRADFERKRAWIEARWPE